MKPLLPLLLLLLLTIQLGASEDVTYTGEGESMPREQIQRLNKKPQVDTKLGQVGTSTTAVVNMPTVVPEKTSGAKLSEAFGLVTEQVVKSYNVSQAAYKEKMKLRVQDEKRDWINTLSGLGTSEEKAQWIEAKINGLSTPEVDPDYRNAAIGALNPFYAKYIPEARAEYNNDVLGQFTDGLVANLETTGSMNYEELTQVYNGEKKLPRGLNHKAVVSGIESWIKQGLTNVTTVGELEEFQVKVENVLSEYKSNTYLGGSKAKEALDLKSMLNTKASALLSKQQTGINAEINAQIDSHKTKYELPITDFTALVNSSNKAPTKKQEEITSYIRYKTFSDKFQQNLFSPSNNINYNTWDSREKAIAKGMVNTQLTNSLQNGYYSTFASLVQNNDVVGQEFLKDVFNISTISQGEAEKNLTLFKGMQGTDDGNRILGKLDGDTLAFYSILSKNPQLDVQSLREGFETSKGEAPRWAMPGLSAAAYKTKETANRKKYEKLTARLTDKHKETADKMFQLYSQRMKPADAITRIEEDFVNKVLVTADNKSTFTGFPVNNVEVLSEAMDKYIFSNMEVDPENMAIDYDGDTVTVKDVENPFLPIIKMPYNDLKTSLAQLKANEVAEEAKQGPGGIEGALQTTEEVMKSISEAKEKVGSWLDGLSETFLGGGEEYIAPGFTDDEPEDVVSPQTTAPTNTPSQESLALAEQMLDVEMNNTTGDAALMAQAATIAEANPLTGGIQVASNQTDAELFDILYPRTQGESRGVRLANSNISTTKLPAIGETENITKYLLDNLSGLDENKNKSFLKEFLGTTKNLSKSAWCGDLASAIVKARGVTPPTNPERAGNWGDTGETVYDYAPNKGVLKGNVSNVQSGDMVIFNKGWGKGKDVRRKANGDFQGTTKSRPYGHVSFVIEVKDDGTIVAIGGNQGNSVKISEYTPKYIKSNFPAGYKINRLPITQDAINVSDFKVGKTKTNESTR